MQFKINQSDFLPVLQSISRSSGVRHQLPVLASILIQYQAGKLRLSATNLEIGVVKSVNAQILEEGEMVIPVRLLTDVISNLSGEDLEFSSSGDQVKISSSSFNSVINTLSASEFPSIPLNGKDPVLFNPDLLTKIIPQISFAAAVDEGRPILTGVLTQVSGKKLELVATDGFRLAHATTELEETQSFKALIPKTTLEEVIKLINEDDVDKVEISLSADQNQIIFKFGLTELSSRLIEGNFPSWEKIIPTEFKARMVIERQKLLKAVKLASVFAKSESNVVKFNLSSQGKVELTSEARDLGSQKNEIEATVEGEELSISFNSRYLTDVLSNNHQTQMIFEFSGNLSACLIKPMGTEGLEYIIMPVNLS
jgi:DNA polymerase III subunit beta